MIKKELEKARDRARYNLINKYTTRKLLRETNKFLKPVLPGGSVFVESVPARYIGQPASIIQISQEGEKK